MHTFTDRVDPASNKPNGALHHTHTPSDSSDSSSEALQPTAQLQQQDSSAFVAQQHGARGQMQQQQQRQEAVPEHPDANESTAVVSPGHVSGQQQRQQQQQPYLQINGVLHREANGLSRISASSDQSSSSDDGSHAGPSSSSLHHSSVPSASAMVQHPHQATRSSSDWGDWAARILQGHQQALHSNPGGEPSTPLQDTPDQAAECRDMVVLGLQGQNHDLER